MPVFSALTLCHILVYASLNFNIYGYQFYCIILLNAVKKIKKMCDGICMVSLGAVCLLLNFFQCFVKMDEDQ